MTDTTATSLSNPYADDYGRHYFFIIGPPGCGKTSSCQALQGGTSSFLHVSVGDYLRELRAQPDEGQIMAVLGSNGLMRGEGLQRLIKQRVTKATEEPQWTTQGIPFNSILVDGFPRSVSQWSDRPEHDPDLPEPLAVIIFQDEKDNVKTRYLGRQDPSRPGENAALFEERWKQYHEKLPALRSMFTAKGWATKVVDVARYSARSDLTCELKQYIDQRLAEASTVVGQRISSV